GRSRKTGVATTRSVMGTARIASADERADGAAGEVGLGNEAARAGLRDQRAEVGTVTARGEDDRARRAGVPEAGCNLEPVDVGQPDVEEHDVRRQTGRLGP